MASVWSISWTLSRQPLTTVGDGVSAECFGDAYNWRDILTSWVDIVEAGTASAVETGAAAAELVHRATACVTASKASGRQPVRLE